MFTLYTPMLHLIFQEQLPTTSFGQQWYFLAPWWWCWIGGVLAWISMAMVNFSTWDYLWTRGFNIVPWSNSLLFNINNIFNCISKRYVILNFYSIAPPWFKKNCNFVFCPICHGFWKQSIVVGLHSIRCGWHKVSGLKVFLWNRIHLVVHLFYKIAQPTYSYSWTKSLTPKSPYFERKKGRSRHI